MLISPQWGRQNSISLMPCRNSSNTAARLIVPAQRVGSIANLDQGGTPGCSFRDCLRNGRLHGELGAALAILPAWTCKENVQVAQFDLPSVRASIA
jgi:hypothetical protein